MSTPRISDSQPSFALTRIRELVQEILNLEAEAKVACDRVMDYYKYLIHPPEKEEVTKLLLHTTLLRPEHLAVGAKDPTP